MTEIANRQYQPLFEVRLLHHYWLDDGATVFDLIPDPDKLNRILLAYDRRKFLTVTPTNATTLSLKTLKAIYKDTALGFMVAMPANGIIPNDIKLEFAISIKDPAFYNYTALTLTPQKIIETSHIAEEKTYRFKSNVFVLSNLTGVARGSEADKSLFLSSKYLTRNAEDKIEALVTSAGGLSQLSSDPPNPTLQRLNTKSTALPAFMHQGDIPAISPSAGLSGAPGKGILLTDGMPDSLFALLRLVPVRSNDNDFSFSENGSPKTRHPIFQVRFKNRSTIRRYVHKRTGLIESTEATPTPLTHFGNAGNRHKPNATTGIKTDISGAKIHRLISEIFV